MFLKLSQILFISASHCVLMCLKNFQTVIVGYMNIIVCVCKTLLKNLLKSMGEGDFKEKGAI